MQAKADARPVKIVFAGKDYSFPAVCACCLSPTSRQEEAKSARTVGVPVVAAVKQVLTYRYPLCDACANLENKVQETTSLLGCLPGVGSVVIFFGGIVMDAEGQAWTACLAVAAAGIVLTLVLLGLSSHRATRRIQRDNPDHPRFCTDGEPVVLCAWESFGAAVFEVENRAFARAVVAAGRASYKDAPAEP
jgi:hypothetical protein